MKKIDETLARLKEPNTVSQEDIDLLIEEIEKLRKVVWIAARFENALVSTYFHPDSEPRREVLIWRRREFIDAMGDEYERIANSGVKPFDKLQTEYSKDFEDARKIIAGRHALQRSTEQD